MVEPEEPVVEEKMYTLDAQGNRVYNSKLLGEVLKEALHFPLREESKNKCIVFDFFI